MILGLISKYTGQDNDSSIRVNTSPLSQVNNIFKSQIYSAQLNPHY